MGKIRNGNAVRKKRFQFQTIDGRSEDVADLPSIPSKFADRGAKMKTIKDKGVKMMLKVMAHSFVPQYLTIVPINDESKISVDSPKYGIFTVTFVRHVGPIVMVENTLYTAKSARVK
jgi:hypothetical protein